MSSPTRELAAILKSVRRPGDFVTSGTVPFVAPALHVDGVGRIALPLLPEQAGRLAAAATRAPFGRGAETLVETTVRRTWQFEPAAVRLEGEGWRKLVEDIVARAAAGLGVDGPVRAEFYKLLLYRAGDFFVSHRDTEKAPGMFATLVAVLPSLSTGGELVVRHLGRETRLDLVPPDPGEIGFAAFYADCPHEVRPVTGGDRLTLVYNLIRSGAGKMPMAPDYRTEEDRLAHFLEGWPRLVPSSLSDWPEKIVYPLDHAYSAAELGFAALKGADSGVAGVLAKAAARSGCDLHLAQLLIEENGWAEHTGGWREEDRFEIGEVNERVLRLTEWRRPDGAPVAWADIPVEKEASELSPPEAVADLEPDHEEFSEATGNEGASFERTYRRAALVLWPADRALAVLNQGGPAATLPYLDDLVGQAAREADPARRAATQGRIRELAGLMTESWPLGRFMQYGVQGAPLLAALTRFGDAGLIEAFLSRAVRGARLDRANMAVLADAFAPLPQERAATALAGVVKATSPLGLAGLSVLFRRLAAERPAVAAPSVPALLDLLPATADDPRLRDEWDRRLTLDTGFVADLLAALVRLDEALAGRAVDRLLAAPALYGFDDVLIPALLDLKGTPDASAAVARLRAAAIEHLRETTAAEPRPPADATRAARLTCACPHCAEVSAFLKDRQAMAFEIKAGAEIRSHVETTLLNSKADLKAETVKIGRPYRLRLTKTEASYEVAAARFRRDLGRLKHLVG